MNLPASETNLDTVSVGQSEPGTSGSLVYFPCQAWADWKSIDERSLLAVFAWFLHCNITEYSTKCSSWQWHSKPITCIYYLCAARHWNNYGTGHV